MSLTPQLVPVFAILRAAYPRWFGEAMTPESIAAWCALLSQQEPVALQRAAVQFAQTSKWPPTVAELIALAVGEDEPEEANCAFETALNGEGGWAHERALAAAGVRDRTLLVSAKNPPDAKRMDDYRRRFVSAYKALAADEQRAKGYERAAQLLEKPDGRALVRPAQEGPRRLPEACCSPQIATAQALLVVALGLFGGYCGHGIARELARESHASDVASVDSLGNSIPGSPGGPGVPFRADERNGENGGGA